MKRSVIILMTLVLSLLCVCCGPRVIGDRPIQSEHFINGLSYLEGIDIVSSDVPNELLVTYSQLTPIRGKELNVALERIGDVDYNKKKQPWEGANVLYNDFLDIDIVSSANFNGIEPGESISTKVMFFALSIQLFIDSNYTIYGNWNDAEMKKFEALHSCMYSEGYPEWQPIYVPLNDVEQSDMALLNSTMGLRLSFVEIPEVKEHTFTVTITDADGRKMTASVDYIFE